MKKKSLEILLLLLINLLLITTAFAQDSSYTKGQEKIQQNIETTKAENTVKDFIRKLFLDRNQTAAFRDYFYLSERDKIDEALLNDKGGAGITRKSNLYDDDLNARFLADLWLSEYAGIYLGLGDDSIDLAKGESSGIISNKYGSLLADCLKKYKTASTQFIYSGLNENDKRSKASIEKYFQFREKIYRDVLETISLKINKERYLLNVEAMIKSSEVEKKIYQGRAYYAVNIDPFFIFIVTKKKAQYKIIFISDSL